MDRAFKGIAPSPLSPSCKVRSWNALHAWLADFGRLRIRLEQSLDIHTASLTQTCAVVSSPLPGTHRLLVGGIGPSVGHRRLVMRRVTCLQPERFAFKRERYLAAHHVQKLFTYMRCYFRGLLPRWHPDQNRFQLSSLRKIRQSSQTGWQSLRS
jgi:hypothetical protein